MVEGLDGPEAPETKRRGVSRRDALKKGAVGAGVMGVVWAAPTIEGLSLRPAYASAASGSLSSAACKGGANFNLPLPCNSNGNGAAMSKSTVTPTGDASAANCGVQGITANTHHADAHPHDANKSVADQFDKVTINDANGRYLLFFVTRDAGNTHCKFTSVNFDGTPSDFNAGNQAYTFNPTNQTPNGRPTKFNSLQTSDQIAIGFASDPNERADLGNEGCRGTAHITLTCT